MEISGPMRRFMAKANNDKSTEKWQSKKSALMRDRIVVGALECIVQFGYENTTMAKIAKMAKVSPGAMQYHFGSKLEAIKAAIDHLHSVRLAQHHRALQEVPEGFNPIDYTYDLYWAQLNEDHFIAYQDLVIAARTDPELANVLRPAYRRFIKAWRQNAFGEVPEWANIERFDVIADLAQYLMEGLAYGRLNSQLSEERTSRLLKLTKKLVIELLDEELSRNEIRKQ